MRMTIRFGCGVLILSNAACAPTGSNDLDLEELHVSYLVSGSQAVAGVREGANGSHVKVAGTDTIWCNGVRLTEANLRGDIEFRLQATVPDAATYEFEFRRGTESHKTRVEAPVPFKITSDALDGTYDSKMLLTWAPTLAGSDVRLSSKMPTYASQCRSGLGELLPADTGSFTIDGFPFRPREGGTPDCTYDLEVSRSVASNLGAPFGGGKATATFVQVTKLHLRP